jgi:hypothetical protein
MPSAVLSLWTTPERAGSPVRSVDRTAAHSKGIYSLPGSSTGMNTLGLERRDGRNLLVVAAIVTVVTAATADGTAGVRLVAGTIAGVFSGVVFVFSTLLINRYKPDHW